MKINDDRTLSFDKNAAGNAGLPKDIIKLGREFVELHNENMEIVKTDGVFSEKFHPDNNKKMNKFAKFFESVKDGKAGRSENQVVSAERIEMWGLVQYADAAGACGGKDQNTPHPRPPWVNSGYTFTTRQAMVNHLTNNVGAHNTYAYAMPNQTANPNYFTQPLPSYLSDCTWGAMRNEIRTSGSGSFWTYEVQSWEPNPEIWHYSWPTAWWPNYVIWWHQYFTP
jgi:hypothetical protein